ncbi:MAG: hypothetical protein ABIE23_06025 [archaeon]
MNWKEFFKPTKEKIILFIVLFFVGATIFFQIENAAVTYFWILLFFTITFIFCYLISCISSAIAGFIISAFNKFKEKK